ncbi:MAG TPA: TolC family protein, partial [Gemmatimonadaceae bacterium]|nr:TolC family protein [Gemmatimonadaceae bacterium]
MRYAARILRGVLPLIHIVSLLALSRAASAQGEPSGQSARRLSLDEALRLAHASSEAMATARARVANADGERIRAKGARALRLSAFSSFDRTLRSEFDGLSFGGASDAGESPADESDEPALPFGSPNTYRAGLSASRTLFTAGRAGAFRRAAANGSRAAEIALTSTRAEVTLTVAEAYFDAALSERLVGIVDTTLAQTESALARAALLLQSGRGSEFDYLRAKVARDRQRPVVMRQHGERDVAVLRLKQLIHVPADEALDLTTGLDVEPDAVTIAVRPVSFARPAQAASESSAEAVAQSVARSAAVQEAAARLGQREQRLAAVRAERWPTLALTSSYERVAYARGSQLPPTRDFRTNWTVGARVELPILTAGQRQADEAEGRASVAAARAELQRTEQLAA